jgi:hypothetical protein
MMPKAVIVTMALMVPVLCVLEASSAGDMPNPHGKHGDCTVCHALTSDELKSGGLSRSEGVRMVRDADSLCKDCHGTAFGHAIGMGTQQNQDNLPLDVDGKITCAFTCHDMHVNNPVDQAQTRMHLRVPPERLCFGCHPE